MTGQIVDFTADRFRRPHLHIARARTFEAVVNRGKPPLVVVGCKNLAFVLHHRRKRQRLAARAGAEIDHLLARFGGRKIAPRIATPRPAPRSGLSGMQARHGSQGSWHRPARRMRKPHGDQRVGSGFTSDKHCCPRFALAFKHIHPQIERSARGQAPLPPPPGLHRTRAKNVRRAIPDNRPPHVAARR